MLQRSLNFILIFLLLVLIVLKSSIGADFLYKKGKISYDSGNYEQAINMFEKALILKPEKPLLRYYYVSALSKLEPKFEVQKKLMEISDSKIDDEAKKYAKSRIAIIRKDLLKDYEPNYINRAVSTNNVLRWDISSFPLNVYIKNVEDAPDYIVENIKKALSIWEERTNFVKFKLTNNENEANIIINFEETPTTNCDGEKCTYLTANTVPGVSSSGILQHMTITMYKKNPHKQYYNEMQIYNTALHELGHALGIMGHSENPQDIMFATNENINNDYAYMRSEWQYLSEADLKTLVLLYRIHPDISNIKKTPFENQFYAPFILGSTDERLSQKLEECLKYVEKYPEIATGYINLAAVYSDSGDIESGLETLNKTDNMQLTNNEKYIVEYNRAVMYFNKQDYNSSLIHANRAKSIKSDTALDELITEINTHKNK